MHDDQSNWSLKRTMKLRWQHLPVLRHVTSLQPWFSTYSMCTFPDYRETVQHHWIHPETPQVRFKAIVCYKFSVYTFLLYIQHFLLFWEYNDLITDNKYLVFSYCHSPACKYQISMSLDCIMLDKRICLISIGICSHF